MIQILYVLAVEEHRNFSKAAASQFVSQPALSQQIKQLEKELGYTLFVRSTHEVDLTGQGHIFCEQARPVAKAWKHFQEQIVQSSGYAPKRLRIGMGSRVYSNGLFEPIVQFFDAHPELEVTFVTEAGCDFLAGLHSGGLDLALDRLPPASLLTDAKSLATVSLVMERQCVLLAADDPRSRLKEIRFADLRGSTIITGLENSMEDRVLRYDCLNSGMAFNRIYRSDGIETNMNLVRGGKGILIGPKSFADYFGVAAVPLIPKTLTSLDFICLQKSADRPEIAALREYLCSLLPDDKKQADAFSSQIDKHD